MVRGGAGIVWVWLLAACGEAPAQKPGADARVATAAAPPAPASRRARQIAIPIEPVAADDAPARFVVRDRVAAAFFVESGFAIALRDDHAAGRGLHVTLPGARAVAPRPEGELPGRVNYFVGPEWKWNVGLPTYSRVVYPEVYPGIDLVCEARRHGIAYRFELASGADAGAIALRWSGATAVRAADSGTTLAIETGAGALRETGLRCSEGGRDAACRYAVSGARDVAFAIGPRDRGKPLVIDPVIEWSSYLGGVDEDYGWGIAVDAGGDAYVTGTTVSTDFPATGGFDTAYGGGAWDAFVTKLNADGSLAWSSYLGGAGLDYGDGIAVDADGNVYVTGETASADFPTIGGFDATLDGTQNAFVTKVNAAGTSLAWSSYLGGSGSDRGFSIVVDSGGNAFVTGGTFSTDFPATGGFDTMLGGSQDAFVTKVDASGDSLVWSSYLGGTDYEQGYGIAIDAAGNAYVAGNTSSTDFPATGGFDTTLGGSQDAFVTKVNAAGSTLAWSSYLGGAGNDDGLGIAVDAGGNAYVTGGTLSTDFPATGGFDTTSGGGTYDAFVTKVSAAGSSLAWSSYLGDAGYDYGYDIAVDAAANAYVAGYTSSTDFPTTGGFDATLSGASDAFVTKVNAAGTSLAWSSYLGGSDSDLGRRIAVEAGGNAYVTGNTYSTDFPTTGGFDTTLGGSSDVFVTRIPPPAANGSACTAGADCESTICEDGLCCAVACGLCDSCDAAGAACGVTPADDAACGVVDCGGLDTACRDYADIETDRCEGAGDCKEAADCAAFTPLAGADCGVCAACDGAGDCVYDAAQDSDCGACEECAAPGSCGPASCPADAGADAAADGAIGGGEAESEAEAEAGEPAAGEPDAGAASRGCDCGVASVPAASMASGVWMALLAWLFALRLVARRRGP